MYSNYPNVKTLHINTSLTDVQLNTLLESVPKVETIIIYECNANNIIINNKNIKFVSINNSIIGKLEIQNNIDCLDIYESTIFNIIHRNIISMIMKTS